MVNQRDGYWWQARRDGEEDTALPGLIPSAHFLTQREAMKNSIAGIDRHGSGLATNAICFLAFNW